MRRAALCSGAHILVTALFKHDPNRVLSTVCKVNAVVGERDVRARVVRCGRDGAEAALRAWRWRRRAARAMAV